MTDPNERCLAIFSLREESAIVVAVKTHKEHLFAVVENVLSPISMVDVPVKDEHFLSLVDGVLSCNRDIVEETEAMELILVSVMARWSYDAVAALEPPISRIIVVIKHGLEGG